MKSKFGRMVLAAPPGRTSHDRAANQSLFERRRVSHLLDVSILVACGWNSHAQHTLANRWLDELDGFSTCSATQMGFLRVSMSAGFGAGYAEARAALQAIVAEAINSVIDRGRYDAEVAAEATDAATIAAYGARCRAILGTAVPD